MTSKETIAIKELLNIFEKEVIPILENICANLEVLTQKKLTQKETFNLQNTILDEEHKTTINRIL